MPALVASPPVRTPLATGLDGPVTDALSTLDRMTSMMVWISYCGLVSAGLIVMGW